MTNEFIDHKDEYVLITGACSGIGKSFANLYLKAGYSLILNGRNEDKLSELKGKLTKKAGDDQNVDTVCADLSSSDEIRKMFDRIDDKNITIFINNAGFGDCGYFPETDEEKELDMIDVNVKAMHLAMKLMLKKMMKNDSGTILNVASSAGLMPGGPFMSAYYATKAYVVSLTRGVAEELKQKGSGIYVAALCPGPVNTNFNNTANVSFALPGISPQRCTRIAYEEMSRKKTIIIPTAIMKGAYVLSRLLPVKPVLKMAGYQQKKKLYK